MNRNRHLKQEFFWHRHRHCGIPQSELTLKSEITIVSRERKKSGGGEGIIYVIYLKN